MRINQKGQAVFPIGCCNGVFDVSRKLQDGRRQCPGAGEVVFDWTDVGFTGVSMLTSLVALQLKIGALGYPVEVILPASQEVDRYISRMNYFRQIGIPHSENFSRHSEGDRFLPIERFSPNEDRSSLPGRVSDTIISHTPLEPNLKASVDYMFGEIMDNVCEHAQSDIGGYIGIQFYPNKHMLELCIADGGCGIPNSLRKNESFAGMEDSELLPRSLERGIGENVRGVRGSQGYGRGMGLAFVKNMVQCAKGTLRIVSGNAGVAVDCNGTRKIANVCYPGTLVSIEMPTSSNEEVTAEELFSGMGESVLLEVLLEKYGAGDRADEKPLDILW